LYLFVKTSAIAYTASTLVTIGTQAVKVLPPDFLGFPGPTPVGYIWKAIGVPAGLFLWLVAFWFFALSTVSVLFGIRQMKFDLSWWAFIFPNAGLTIAAIQIGNALGSPAIGLVCSAATVLIVMVWLVVAVANVRAVWKREVLWPGMDEDMEDIEGHPAEDGLGNRHRMD
jgi:tellurite resistance protein TehA-like permease